MVDPQVLIILKSLILGRVKEVIRLHQLVNLVCRLVQLLRLLGLRILKLLFVRCLLKLANGHLKLDHILVRELTGSISVYELCSKDLVVLFLDSEI